jgi:hypothetical protein
VTGFGLWQDISVSATRLSHPDEHLHSVRRYSSWGFDHHTATNLWIVSDMLAEPFGRHLGNGTPPYP